MDMGIRVSCPDSPLVLINVWEELVLKKCEVCMWGGLLLTLNLGCLRGRPRLQTRKSWLACGPGIEQKIVLGRHKNSAMEIAQFCVITEMIALWEPCSYCSECLIPKGVVKGLIQLWSQWQPSGRCTHREQEAALWSQYLHLFLHFPSSGKKKWFVTHVWNVLKREQSSKQVNPFFFFC